MNRVILFILFLSSRLKQDIRYDLFEVDVFTDVIQFEKKQHSANNHISSQFQNNQLKKRIIHQ